MKRRAILIGTNNATSAQLNGVDADVRRLHRHLRSDFGGAWEQEEIEYYKAPEIPTLEKVLERVAGEVPDFLLIFFSGHGFEDDGGEPYISLCDDHDFPINNLRLHVPRQITIIDACRVVMKGALTEARVKTATTAGLSGVDAVDYRASCRAMFDARLSAISLGEVILHACSRGEFSSDYPTGGLFSHSLLDIAQTTASNQSNWYRSAKCMSICTAFNTAKTATLRHNPEQTPVSFVWDDGCDLPFAVA